MNTALEHLSYDELHQENTNLKIELACLREELNALKRMIFGQKNQ